MFKSIIPTDPARPPLSKEEKARRTVRLCELFIVFLLVTLGTFYALRLWHAPALPPDGSATTLQNGFYTLGGALLVAGLGTAVVAALQSPARMRRSVWQCPLVAAALSLCLFILGYAFVGVWPLGEKSILMVDMHHQYAPLLSELRQMLLTGGDFTYSFHIGMGASFIPTFAYYLASPLNFLLVLFEEKHLTEAILLITLLKGAAAAATFTALSQYLYRRRTSAVVLVGVLYSLTGYMLAYSWNIMWLDVVALLPVVVLAMEHMLRTGRIAPYAGMLALALFANYYIGFMLCVFLVLYMVVWLVRRARTGQEILLGCARFAAGSLWGAGMAAALLIPTALALGRTSAAGEEMKAFATNFPFFDLLGRLFYGATPTIRSGNLPNLYCGVPAVLLLPIYLSQKQIPLRRRLSYGGLLTVLLLSCTVNQWDLAWHGFHSPNDLPYRFSFLVCFVLLLMAGHVLTRLERVTPRQILGSLLGCAAYLALWEKLGELLEAADADAAEKVTTTPELLYINLMLLVLYAVILLIGALRRAPRRVASRLLLTVVCAELLIGTSETLSTMNHNEYFTRHEDYIYNISHTATDAALRRAEELAAAEADTEGTFVRMEYLPRTSCMDTALHHYSGLTTFASSNPYLTTKFMGELGYAFNGVNSYLYHSFVAPVDSLMGLRYVVLSANLTNHAQLEQVDSVTVTDPETGTSETRYIYRNRLALPVGFVASSAVRDYSGTQYAPFASQQDLYESLSGRTAQIYVPMDIEADTSGASITGSSFYMPQNDQSTEFSAEVTTQGQYFAYVDCRAAKTISVATYRAEGTAKDSWSVTTHEPYIIDMGTLTEGERVLVTLTGEIAATGNIHLVRLDTDALEEHLSVLREGGLLVTEHDHGYIKGTVTAQEEGALFFSIPYDTGWTVTVDGVEVETFPVDSNEETVLNDEGESVVTGGDDGALLAAAIPAGTHTVVLTYTAPGQVLGTVISVICLLLLAAPAAWKAIRRRASIPTSQPMPAEALPAEAPAAETASPAETPSEELPSVSDESPVSDNSPVSDESPVFDGRENSPQPEV